MKESKYHAHVWNNKTLIIKLGGCFAGGQQWLVCGVFFKIRQSNMAAKKAMVHRSSFHKIHSLKFCAFWQNFYFYRRSWTSHFTCQSKSFISIFFTCQVSACELQPFSCHDLANDVSSQTVKTVFSHLNIQGWTLQKSRDKEYMVALKY